MFEEIGFISQAGCRHLGIFAKCITGESKVRTSVCAPQLLGTTVHVPLQIRDAVNAS